MRRLLQSAITLAFLLTVFWWLGLGTLLAPLDVWGRAGTTFIGIPYTSNEGINTGFKTIDDVVCGGLAPLAPCQLPPTQTLTVVGLLTAGQLSAGSLSVTGPLTVNGLTSTSYVHAATEITGTSVNVTGNLTTGSTGAVIAPSITASGSNAAAVPLRVIGATGQTANLQEWQLLPGDPGPAAYIDATGALNLTQVGTPFNPGKLSYDASSGAVVVSNISLSGKFINNTGANFRTISGCTTAAAAGASCTDNLGWPVTFPSASYRPVCTCEWSSGAPLLYVSNLTTTTMTLTTTAMTAVAAHCAQIHCIAFKT